MVKWNSAYLWLFFLKIVLYKPQYYPGQTLSMLEYKTSKEDPGVRSVTVLLKLQLSCRILLIK